MPSNAITTARPEFAENRLSPLHDERLLRSRFDVALDSAFQDQVEELSGFTADALERHSNFLM